MISPFAETNDILTHMAYEDVNNSVYFRGLHLLSEGIMLISNIYENHIEYNVEFSTLPGSVMRYVKDVNFT